MPEDATSKGHAQSNLELWTLLEQLEAPESTED